MARTRRVQGQAPNGVGSPSLDQAEASLRWLAREPAEQAELLDAIFAASPCRIYVTDQAGRYIYVSLPGARLLGLDRNPMLGKTWRELRLPAEAMAPLDAIQQRAFATGASATGEMELRTAEGLRSFQYVINPVRLPGRPIAAVNTCLQDITERKQAEAKRAASESNYRAIFDAANDAIFVHDTETGRILDTNRKTSELYGYTPDEARRLDIAALSAGTPPYAQEDAVRRVRTAAAGEPQLFEWLAKDRWGRLFWVEVNLRLATLGGQPRILAIVRDIGERKRLQEQREDILRAVSHDLRNPLAAVLAQAELLERQLQHAGAGPQTVQLAGAIITAAQRMNTMIQELVDATRLESGPPALSRRPIHLLSFAADLKQRLAPTLDMRRVRAEAPPDLPPVLADPDRLERIFTNLLSNALKYSTPGTEVTVSFAPRDGEVVSSVTDRGPGIAADELPRLFERYYRTRAARERPEGLGLGLYITRRLVEAHGGRIWAESQPGVGSTFSFSLPVAGAGAGNPGAEPPG